VKKGRETVAQTENELLAKAGFTGAGRSFAAIADLHRFCRQLRCLSPTGPIPATDSTIRSPQRLFAFVHASAAQPLTQLQAHYSLYLSQKKERD
jgi:hypothetical protein